MKELAQIALAALASSCGSAAPEAPVAAARAEGPPVAQAANGRVTLHFTPQARAAVEAALAQPRERDKALGAVLDAGSPASNQKPLG